MNTNNKVKLMVQAALLMALAIIIPVYFSFLKVIIGPFTATLASHVPMFLSMFLGPFAAAFVGLGSTIGFQMSGMPSFVVARAASHIVVGVVGAYYLKKGTSYTKVVAITAPIHAILEAIAIIPFQGFTIYNYIVAGGTLAHHTVDAVISYVFVKALASAGQKEFKLASIK